MFIGKLEHEAKCLVLQWKAALCQAAGTTHSGRSVDKGLMGWCCSGERCGDFTEGRSEPFS